jgi:hypothetical protein
MTVHQTSAFAEADKLRQAAPIVARSEFFMRFLGEDGKVLEGQFTVRRLSIREIGMVSVRRVQLNGGFYYNEKTPGQGIDETTDWTHQMIAHLELALVQKPLWFDLNTIMELDILCEVYTKVMEFENTFRNRQRGATTVVGSGQSGSLGEGKQSGNAGSITPVVGGQVQAALQP